MTATFRYDEAPRLQFAVAFPQSLNLYQYAGNNPVTTVDRDGHCAICIVVVAAAAVAAIAGIVHEARKFGQSVREAKEAHQRVNDDIISMVKNPGDPNVDIAADFDRAHRADLRVGIQGAKLGVEAEGGIDAAGAIAGTEVSTAAQAITSVATQFTSGAATVEDHALLSNSQQLPKTLQGRPVKIKACKEHTSCGSKLGSGARSTAPIAGEGGGSI